MTRKACEVLSQSALLLQISGFQYFSIKDLFEDKNEKCKRLAYNFFFIFMIIWMPFGILFIAAILSSQEIVQEENELNVKNVFNSFINLLLQLGFIATIAISLVASFVGTKSMKQFHKNLILYEELVESIECFPVNYGKFRKHILVNFAVQMVYTIVGSVIKQFYSNGLSSQFKFPYNLVVILLWPSYFVCYMTSLMFVYHVILINIHLEHINRLLCETPTYNVKIIILELYNIIKENSEILNNHQGISMLTNFIFNSVYCVVTIYNIFLTAIGKTESDVDGEFCLKRL